MKAAFILQRLTIRSSGHLLIQLQKFLCDYEVSCIQDTTMYNPWPGDGAVCILLCELVKVSQTITVGIFV